MNEDIYYYKGNPYIIVGLCKIKIHKRLFFLWNRSKWVDGIMYQQQIYVDNATIYVRTGNDFHSKFVKS